MKLYIIIYNDCIFGRKTTILFKLLYVSNTNNNIATESQFLAYDKFFKLEIFHFVYTFVIQNIIMTAKTNIFIIKNESLTFITIYSLILERIFLLQYL